jgi:hypothetical protein
MQPVAAPRRPDIRLQLSAERVGHSQLDDGSPNRALSHPHVRSLDHQKNPKFVPKCATWVKLGTCRMNPETGTVSRSACETTTDLSRRGDDLGGTE